MKPELRVKALLYTNTIRSKSAALLIKEREYEKFKDVISRGKLPPDIEKRSMVRLEVKSLEDLAIILSVFASRQPHSDATHERLPTLFAFLSPFPFRQ